MSDVGWKSHCHPMAGVRFNVKDDGSTATLEIRCHFCDWLVKQLDFRHEARRLLLNLYPVRMP